MRHRPQYVALPPVFGLSFSKGTFLSRPGHFACHRGRSQWYPRRVARSTVAHLVLPPPFQSVTHRIVLTALRFDCDIRALPLLLQECVRLRRAQFACVAPPNRAREQRRNWRKKNRTVRAKAYGRFQPGISRAWHQRACGPARCGHPAPRGRRPWIQGYQRLRLRVPRRGAHRSVLGRPRPHFWIAPYDTSAVRVMPSPSAGSAGIVGSSSFSGPRVNCSWSHESRINYHVRGCRGRDSHSPNSPQAKVRRRIC